MKDHVLIVDDNIEIIELLEDILENEGFEVSTAESGESALELLKNGEKKPNLILLDIMMPNMSGYELCSQIRREWDLPILFLSAKGKAVDKVVGFEIGADDYITKPFDTEELLARIRAHLRRYERIRKHTEEQPEKEAANSPITVLKFKDLEIHKETYSVYVSSEKIDLSTKEFQLLTFLAENAGIVFTREQIYDRVWGYGYGSLNTVTVHIKNLREKLEMNRQFIKTQWGTGYVFIGEKL